MNVIIAGSRNCKNRRFHEFLNEMEKLETPLEKFIKPERDTVFCGEAQGADEWGRQWALRNKIPIQYFPADWENYGKAAGPLRNKQMVSESSLIIALWDFESKGTYDLITNGIFQNVLMVIYVYPEDPNKTGWITCGKGLFEAFNRMHKKAYGKTSEDVELLLEKYSPKDPYEEVAA